MPESSPHWDALLRPKRVALVGASERKRYSNLVVKNMASLGFEGEILFVNPNRDTVYGQPCYPSISALPKSVDCVIASIPAEAVPSMVAEGLQSGIRAFVVYAAGFAEASLEGKQRQEQIATMCREAGALMVGPNCLGVINPKDGVALYGAPIPPELPAGPVGVVTQSGSAGALLMNYIRGIGFSYICTTGNEAIITAEDMIDHYVDDPGTRIILTFIEGLRQPRRFVQVARRALAAGKPIVAIKIGLTDAGSRVARGHTGALTGAARVYEAIFRECGVIQVSDFDEMAAVAEAFVRTGRMPSGGRTALVGISGGEQGLMADVAASLGMCVPDFSPQTLHEIHEALHAPDLVPILNPLDVGVGFHPDGFDVVVEKAMVAVGHDPAIDMIVFPQDAQINVSDDQMPFRHNVVDGIVRALPQIDKPVLVFSPLSVDLHPDLVAKLRPAGVPCMIGTREGLLAAKHLGWFAERRKDVPPASYTPDPARVRRSVGGVPSGQTELGERATKLLLAEYGIPVTREGLATSEAEAAQLAAEIGCPVVLKIESPEIIHKSDVGGVRLGITSPQQAAEAYTMMMAAVREHCPEAHLSGVLVAKQVASGVEMIMGVRQDPQFGPVLVVGLGGLLVEVLNQVALVVPPLTHASALHLLETFPGHRVLDAFRGREAADREAAADVLVRLGQLSLDGEGLFSELDINPLIVGPRGQGCSVVDASLILAA